MDAGLKHGWRSGLEKSACDDLKARNVAYRYESFFIPFTPRPKRRRYTPDILLLANAIIVELKGRFTTADRQKHLDVKAEHPDLDIRIVFSNSRSRISKQSKTTYAMWCESHGFQFADRVIPQAWVNERESPKARAALDAVLEQQKK